MKDTKNNFEPYEIEAFRPAEKIGLVASMDSGGLPHLTLITSISAAGPRVLTLGEFCRGMSKQYIQKNPKIAFAVMTMDKKMWRGRARWTHLRKEGPEYEDYNKLPMFRYNSYFGINTVHYLDLISHGGCESLPVGRIIIAALLTKLVKAGAGTNRKARILKHFAESIFNRLDGLKFISYIGKDGFPEIIPVLQCQAADSTRLCFSDAVYGRELAIIPKGADVAVFGLTMAMEDVLVRGKFLGFSRTRLVNTGLVDIEWVYNSMPPCHGQVYPETKLEPVMNFQ